MQKEPVLTVRIIFQTPPRIHPPRSPTQHEKCLEGVPLRTACQMVQDFTAYRDDPSTSNRRCLYTYHPAADLGAPYGTAGEQTLISLDFQEILVLETTEPLSTSGL